MPGVGCTNMFSSLTVNLPSDGNFLVQQAASIPPFLALSAQGTFSSSAPGAVSRKFVRCALCTRLPSAEHCWEGRGGGKGR